MSLSEPARGVSRILSLHVEIEAVFALHQELLLVGAVTQARRALGLHRELLELHMDHEELLLLPRLARFEKTPRWAPRLYLGQHVKLRELLTRMELRLQSIPEAGGARRRATLDLLDLESTYKRLTEHHDDMERRGLFWTLERCLAPAEQAHIVERCLSAWETVSRRVAPSLRDAKAALPER